MTYVQGITVPFDTHAASTARAALAEFCRVNEVPHPYVDDVLLVVSELVSNAVVHARARPGGGLLVRWRQMGPELLLTVGDGGADAEPVMREVDVEAVSGRGLALVAGLSRRWWFDVDPDGATVHALVPVA
jgi:anti-sigma regulatory factor (Ser/Thr protein kinase)